MQNSFCHAGSSFLEGFVFGSVSETEEMDQGDKPASSMICACYVLSSWNLLIATLVGLSRKVKYLKSGLTSFGTWWYCRLNCRSHCAARSEDLQS